MCKFQDLAIDNIILAYTWEINLHRHLLSELNHEQCVAMEACIYWNQALLVLLRLDLLFNCIIFVLKTTLFLIFVFFFCSLLKSKARSFFVAFNGSWSGSWWSYSTGYQPSIKLLANPWGYHPISKTPCDSFSLRDLANIIHWHHLWDLTKICKWICFFIL